ncbi:hypothetical protein [Corallococcus macrosporus]|uniref:Beta-ketoacyl synthase N-terminal domain-containing protein n=1 Tax=Corallococcus macrosporus DSM 14697 TaxID=1189310 RepID=A0A250JP44_9BACT|nr:hypothetical protein [Corallococcus macrosporus]ATB45390.1 hypothetical protein MYMAC_000975 [Corallococcus macrosporus DSM 14697]
MPPATGIVISGLGMVSSLGFDVVTNCAAQRAGLTWRHPLTQAVAYDEAELEAPVSGAPIEGFTNGFIQSGTWVRMAVTALEDLVDYGQLPGREDARFWQTTGVAWVLPPLLFERFFWPEPEVPALLETYCADLLARLTQLPLQMIPGGFIPGGPHGVATAVQRAEALFTRGRMERVLILGTDSWLDRPSINLLVREGRLKTSERPVGLCPSESAACVLVERASLAEQRGARAESRILAAAVQDAPEAPSAEAEEAPVLSRSQWAPTWGRQLASSIQRTLEAAGVREPFRGDILVDLNGEEWRARVWGHAQQLLQEQVDFSGSRLVIPAIAFGDVGAASGVVSLCVATRSYVRGYALASRTLICSVSDDGGTGAVLTEALPRKPSQAP